MYKGCQLSRLQNYKAEGGKTPGHMLDRLVAGVLHPFIHVGFGLEFRDQVMLAEG